MKRKTFAVIFAVIAHLLLIGWAFLPDYVVYVQKGSANIYHNWVYVYGRSCSIIYLSIVWHWLYTLGLFIYDYLQEK